MISKPILKNSSLQMIITGQVINQFGAWLYSLAMPLLVLYLTGSSVLMGVMYAIGYVAEFVVGFFGGAIVDNFERKKILIYIAVLQAIAISAIPVLHITGIKNIAILFIATIIIDFCNQLYAIADVSILPNIVEKEDLPDANGFMQMVMSVTDVISPSIAGALISLVGLFGSLWFNTLSFLCLIVPLFYIKIAVEQKTKQTLSPKKIWNSSIDGLKYTLSKGLFRSLLLWSSFINFGLSGGILMVIYHLQSTMHATESEMGFVMTFGAIGGIISGIVFSKIQTLFKSGKLIIFSSIGYSVMFIIFAYVHNWILFGIAYGIINLFISINRRLKSILYQSTVPSEYLGRVTASSRLVSSLLSPLSVLIAGWVARDFGSSYVFLSSSIVIAATSIIGLFTILNNSDWAIQKKRNTSI